jgi:hypothetical protein
MTEPEAIILKVASSVIDPVVDCIQNQAESDSAAKSLSFSYNSQSAGCWISFAHL